MQGVFGVLNLILRGPFGARTTSNEALWVYEYLHSVRSLPDS